MHVSLFSFTLKNFVFVCVYVLVCVRIRMYVCLYVCVSVCMCACMSACMCLWLRQMIVCRQRRWCLLLNQFANLWDMVAPWLRRLSTGGSWVRLPF